MLDADNSTTEITTPVTLADGAGSAGGASAEPAAAPVKKAARKAAPRKVAAKVVAADLGAEPEQAQAQQPAPRKAAAKRAGRAVKKPADADAGEVGGPDSNADAGAEGEGAVPVKATRSGRATKSGASKATAPKAPGAAGAAGVARAPKVAAAKAKTTKATDQLADAAELDAPVVTEGMVAAKAPAVTAESAVAVEPVMAAPAVLFVAPVAEPIVAPAAPAAPARRRAVRKAAPAAAMSVQPVLDDGGAEPPFDADAAMDDATLDDAEVDAELSAEEEAAALEAEEIREAAAEEATGARRRRRRGRRGRGRPREDAEIDAESSSGDPDDLRPDAAQPGGDGDADNATDGDTDNDPDSDSDTDNDTDSGDGDGGPTTAARRRRRRRRAGTGDSDGTVDDPPNTVVHVRERRNGGGGSRDDAADDDGVRGVKGSTRLEAKRQRRRDGRDSGRRRPSILSEAEFLARREAVDRVMAVRQSGDRTQIAVLEDGVLVEHYVTRASATSYVGNVYLGRVQNVLPSMEAAFVDIGKGRNGVLYAGEVNWDAAGLEGKSRAIEHAMSSGDPVLVQVTKDPIGHKGARLTSQISLPGRFLVYVPGGGMTGISRKLPDTERQRLKAILKKIVPEDAGVIIRTAAEGATEEEITHDVDRLKAEWESISAKAAQKKNAPALMHGEPDLAIRVVRDVFNEDFKSLVVQGEDAWQTISGYLGDVAPELAVRASRHTAETDLFHDLRVDEGLAKALDRKVWLPSGGSLVIDRTEAMTVIDVNTGKFIGSGGNLEQTVTRNNIEAAEEIVRQLRLRDVGGIVVIDFIDMVLESNRELVLRRLTECLGRDRTKHQVAEVTSLGLVQMTRKRVGEGLLEAFSETCETCHGRGVIVHTEPVDISGEEDGSDVDSQPRKRASRRGGSKKAAETAEPEVDPEVEEQRRRAAASAMALIHRAAHGEGDEVPAEAAPGNESAAAPGNESEAVNGAASAPVLGRLSGRLVRAGATASTQAGSVDQLPVEPVPQPVAAVPVAAVPVAAVPVAAVPAGPAVEEAVPGAAPARRRRRAASRPAGPPVSTDG